MNTVIVIQARMGSSRLAGKVLLPLAGKTLLERMVERVSAAKLADEVIVATTTNTDDDRIETLCLNAGINVFRGHPTDLIDRHYKAALEYRAEVVVKIPSDCPLIDPAIIDRVLQYYFDNAARFDFVSNLHPATYPDGNDVEVMPLPVLKKAWFEAAKDYEREHLTPFIWEQPERFRIGNVEWERGLDYSMSHRFTIDYPEDYRFISKVYDELCSEERPIFSMEDILLLLLEKPEIYDINASFAGVNWYRNHLMDLKTISASQTNFAPSEA
ncbi:MAG TPA: glycosyltransferase family protein [Candidatus Kapabacteria bacterium]|nr:glycosyltransferase family protein [Candidatus Kapabacteria bacterium]